MDIEELKIYLKENLKLVINQETSSEYVGGLTDGSSMYKDYSFVSISLELEGDQISYDSFSIG